MGTKCITITNEAYELLAAHKGKNESFSDVVTKLLKIHSLLDLVGILSSQDAALLERHHTKINNKLHQRLSSVQEGLYDS